MAASDGKLFDQLQKMKDSYPSMTATRSIQKRHGIITTASLASLQQVCWASPLPNATICNSPRARIPRHFPNTPSSTSPD